MSEIISKTENNFLENPIDLSEDLVLTNDDIESLVSHDEVPKETLVWKYKEGFPTYHLNPDSRLLVIYFETGPKLFRLNKDSRLINKYIEKYFHKDINE